MEKAPQYVNMVLQMLWDAGYEAYPVGGCVRDALLGKIPQDWDICTSARPEQTKAVFSAFPVIETGIRHGTVTVVADGKPVEITTFRTEGGYADNRHPSRVAFVRSLAEDLARRDFTINAMAFDRDGSVIDLYGGQADLLAGRIRCVGDADSRFREDALRILRGLRFASRLGFSLEEETARAVRENRTRLAHISEERIFSELKGILTGPGAGAVLREFSDVFFEFLPELRAEAGFEQHNAHHIHDVWCHTTMAVDAIEPDPTLRLTMLLHDVGKPECFFIGEDGSGHFYGHAEAGMKHADAILRRLKCDNAAREEVLCLIRHHDMEPPSTLKGTRRLLIQLGETELRRLIACWKADSADRAEAVRARNFGVIGVTEGFLEELLEKESCFSLRDLAVKGGDILALGAEKGPAIGAVLRELFRLVTEEGLENNREALLKQAEKLVMNGNDETR